MDTCTLSRHKAILEELVCSAHCDRSDARIVSLVQMAIAKRWNITNELQNAVAAQRQPAECTEPAETLESSHCELCTEDPSASAVTTLSSIRNDLCNYEDLLHFTIQRDYNDSLERESDAGIYVIMIYNYRYNYMNFKLAGIYSL